MVFNFHAAVGMCIAVLLHQRLPICVIREGNGKHGSGSFANEGVCVAVSAKNRTEPTCSNDVGDNECPDV